MITGKLTKIFRRHDPYDKGIPYVQDGQSFSGILGVGFFNMEGIKSLDEIKPGEVLTVTCGRMDEYMHTSKIEGVYRPETDKDKVMFAMTPEEVSRLANIKPNGDYAIITTLNSMYLLDEIIHASNGNS